MYLMRNWPEGHKVADDRPYYPAGLPGQIGEAAFQMDIWNNAVDRLDGLGLIDRTRVGIIGFSRPGWYTSFILAHSDIPFKAATITDNVDYSFVSYALHLDDQQRVADDAMYGGPPMGDTLKNWLAYSVSFNLSRIRTPLLMEEMGYQTQFDDRLKPPIDLARRFELFNGLQHLGKPVELFYYPNEGHQPQDPQARLGSIRRNTDWYRFWLQGYKRPNPEDPDLYKRWEQLQMMQNAEDRQGKGIAPIPAAQ
jgi:dipeptidyl aminopeptidase/acylaminoacyl peptidase